MAGGLRAWWGGLRRRPAADLRGDAPDLVIVVESYDPAEADSAALDRAGDWRLEEPAVLRHHLRLPENRIDEARELLDQDHWTLRRTAADQVKYGKVVLVTASRVQRLDALHCAQESARMAGLAQRLGGDALGWDALQPGPGGTPAND